MLDGNDVLQIVELMMLTCLIAFEIYKFKTKSDKKLPQTFIHPPIHQPTPFATNLPGMTIHQN